MKVEKKHRQTGRPGQSDGPGVPEHQSGLVPQRPRHHHRQHRQGQADAGGGRGLGQEEQTEGKMVCPYCRIFDELDVLWIPD